MYCLKFRNKKILKYFLGIQEHFPRIHLLRTAGFNLKLTFLLHYMNVLLHDRNAHKIQMALHKRKHRGKLLISLRYFKESICLFSYDFKTTPPKVLRKPPLR